MLVKGDYSQLQMRIAARIAGDKRMQHAYANGEDLHTLTACALTGKPEVTKEERQLAKAVNFGLLFGLGAKGLRGYARGEYGLDQTLEEAAHYRRAFFATYVGLARWHRAAGAATAKECRTLAGRRRLLHDNTPYTHRLNTPVQATEADGVKLAMALLWERHAQAPGAVPVLFCHDEIVVEADNDQADVAAAWLKTAMVDAMAPLIAPVPVEVEVEIAPTWGGCDGAGRPAILDDLASPSWNDLMGRKRVRFSDELRQALDGCGMSRYRIARLLAVSEATLSRFTSGERGLTMKCLDKLAALLDLHVAAGKRPKRGKSR